MAIESKIQWTEATWNPWHGCRKVSAGCKYCYMYRDKERYGQDPTTVLRSKTNFKAPLNWKEPKLIFTCSWSDWFIEEADEWRAEAWEIIKATPHHTYQILTKRPERILMNLPADWGEGYPNVWLGVSVENQDAARDRLAIFQEVPARVRFISAEPLIGPVDFKITDYISNGLSVTSNYLNGWTSEWSSQTPPNNRGVSYERGLDWVIVGGESGHETGNYRYRPCELLWIAQIVSQCADYGVPVFVKQLGTALAKRLNMRDTHGGDIAEWESRSILKSFAIRQMPKVYEHSV